MIMNIFLPLVSLAALFAACVPSAKQPAGDLPEQLLRVAYESTLDEQPKEFFLYLPRNYDADPNKKWPVLLFLHGDGERGNGREELDFVMIHGPLYEAWVQKRDLPFVIISPQLPMFGRDTMGISYLVNRDPEEIPKRLEQGVPAREADFGTQGPMMGAVPFEDFSSVPPILPQGWDLCEKDLLTMLDQVLAGYRTDPDRVYLSGLSYGGWGTWDMASKHPQRFAAIVPVVGWGHPDLMAPIAQQQLPVWAFAGGRDGVVPLSHFYGGINQLETLGHPEVRFTVHEDMGHDAWKRVYGGEDVYSWMLGFRRQ